MTTKKLWEHESSGVLHSCKSSDTSPFATPCTERVAQKRRALVSDRNPTLPQYVYHLYTSIQEDDRLPPIFQLQRTYAQSELANLDASSWLIERLRSHDVIPSYWEDKEYFEKTDRKCQKFGTLPVLSQIWKVSYSAWTVEERLY